MPLIQEKTAQHKTPPEISAEDALSYRIAKPVTHIIIYGRGGSYPLCPRCNRGLDREFMNYCNNCGQHLGWKHFSSATVCSTSATQQRGTI